MLTKKKLPGQGEVGRKFENVVGEALFREAFLLPLVLGAISMWQLTQSGEWERNIVQNSLLIRFEHFICTYKCIRLRDRLVNYRPLFGLTPAPTLLSWPEYLLIFLQELAHTRIYMLWEFAMKRPVGRACLRRIFQNSTSICSTPCSPYNRRGTWSYPGIWYKTGPRANDIKNKIPSEMVAA